MELIPREHALLMETTDRSRFARVTGDGPSTAVFLHAIGIDSRSWRGVTAWMPRGMRCVALDLRGFGRSTGTPVSLSDHADDVVSVLDELGVERAHVYGHSYGGAVAATAALEHTTRIASLGLIASIITAPGEMFRQRALDAEAGGVESYLEATLTRWFTESELVDRGRPVEYVAEALAETALASWTAGWRVLADYDLAPRLTAISVPTVVVAAELDASIPFSQLSAASESIPNASLKVISGAAHMVPVEKPFELAQILYAHQRSSDE
jgi:pimeloyl-ACP methyl ester carboxylesterase